MDELGLQDAPVWIRANVRETLWMAQQADEIQQTIDQRAALGTGEEGEDAEVIPLNSAFHRNPGRRAKRRQMVLEQRGHPQ